MKLKDDQGKSMPAVDVFAASIKYLKQKLMEKLKDRIKDIRETDIHWVITVPAIWNDAAKQFMKIAAGQVRKIKVNARDYYTDY